MEPRLLEGFRRGDREALERIYRQYAGRVESRIRLVLIRAGQLRKADLADIVQDAFIHAFSDPVRVRYDGKREYGPFLLTIARNIVIDWMRRRCREVPTADLEECLSEEREPWQVEEQPSTDDVAPVGEVDAYVRGLSPELRRVYRCRFALGLAQRDAARALGLSRQSIRTLEKALLAGLRRHLRRARLPSVADRSPYARQAEASSPSPERMVAVARRR